VQAVFREILTTNYPTPWWWLAANGFTQNFENVVGTIGSNGMPVWQSYVAGLNPNDPGSQLRLWLNSAAENTVVLHWDSVTGRVYTVWSSSNPAEGYSPIRNAIKLPATITGLTNVIGDSAPATFYRLGVEKP
jgi:hypothetical protein